MVQIKEKKALAEKELSLLKSRYSDELRVAEEKKAEYDKICGEAVLKENENISLNEKISSLQTLTEEYKQKKEDILKQIEESETKKSEYNEKLNILLENKEKCEQASEKVFDEHKNLKEEFDELNKNMQRLSEKKLALKNSISQKNSKLDVLTEMEHELEGYSKSVKAVMNASKDDLLEGANLHGPLSTLIHTEDKYVTAIEVALQNANQNIVCDNEEDAKRAINYLRKNNLGRATFLPLSAVKPRNTDTSRVEGEKGYIALASELVSSDEIYKDAVSSVLGAVVVADNIDNAVLLAKKSGHKLMIVTLRGDLLRVGGAITGGSLGKNTGFLSRSSEMEKLSFEISELKQESKNAEAEYEIVSKKAAEVFEKSSISEKFASAAKEEFIKARYEYESFLNVLNSISGGREELEKELDLAKEKICEFSENIKANENKILSNTEFLNEFGEKKSELEALVKELEQKVTKLSDGMVAANMELSGILKDEEHQTERLEDVRVQRDNVENVNTERKLEIEDREKRICEMTERIEFFAKEREELEKNTVLKNQSIAKLGESKNKLNEDVRRLQEESKNTRQSFFAVSQQKLKLEARKAKGEAELDAVFDRLWEEYELSFSEAEKLALPDAEFNRNTAAKRISEIKINIKNLGNINIDAIEGYKSVKERFEFLSAQTDDLNRAKTELEDIIEELLKVMKSQFAEKFQIINKNFNSVFKELFGGGTAKLALSDPENILESGIEIEAQPPGKKLQSLTLLSGGERAFTAIALLFAILNVRPTPFCILDEIEAALDDVNVYRYADYLKKYCGKTQFIVVTHRRGTMEAANILYGVTMQERGVSKLLSLNIDEVVE